MDAQDTIKDNECRMPDVGWWVTSTRLMYALTDYVSDNAKNTWSRCNREVEVVEQQMLGTTTGHAQKTWLPCTIFQGPFPIRKESSHFLLCI